MNRVGETREIRDGGRQKRKKRRGEGANPGLDHECFVDFFFLSLSFSSSFYDALICSVQLQTEKIISLFGRSPTGAALVEERGVGREKPADFKGTI